MVCYENHLVSPTTSLTSLREDSDYEDIHQASSGLQPSYESQHMGNGPLTEKIDVGSNSSYLMHPFSGDCGQPSISGTNYIPLIHRDKFRGNDTAYIDDQKTHGMASWGTVLPTIAKLHSDPSFALYSSIPSSSIGNVLEQGCTPLGSGLIKEAESSQSLQSNWQIPFEDNSRHMSTLTQSLSLEFESGYDTVDPDIVVLRAARAALIENQDVVDIAIIKMHDDPRKGDTLVFTSKKASVDEIESQLAQKGFKVVAHAYVILEFEVVSRQNSEVASGGPHGMIFSQMQKKATRNK
ncbi:hypothetical protein VNO77_44033 [Canavalia gladiata]|uniref:Uncharacterized protein n=1 Tax=Canavalia gladiata TaxID=3824 RepID=A0AAN9JW63_CANGL